VRTAKTPTTLHKRSAFGKYTKSSHKPITSRRQSFLTRSALPKAPALVPSDQKNRHNFDTFLITAHEIQKGSNDPQKNQRRRKHRDCASPPETKERHSVNHRTPTRTNPVDAWSKEPLTIIANQEGIHNNDLLNAYKNQPRTLPLEQVWTLPH